jgi:Fe-S cluster biogenesis protein NfuA
LSPVFVDFKPKSNYTGSKRDGGSVELVSVEDSVVKVRLTGACHGCPMSQMTLKAGIERIIKQEVPEIKEVLAV